ncbi:MAG: pyruvate kinase [Syntrophobacteraceae bacterium]|nr:pyruvate kinase [Syntrophobacteraceae bacterium]
MSLPPNKTKIVCTIGPASSSLETLERMILAGMNIARINFSHGSFSEHTEVIRNIREAGNRTGRRIAILGDLPGPKMRIGHLVEEPIELETGDIFILTALPSVSEPARVSITFTHLPNVVKPGDSLFLNDGLIELEVIQVDAFDVRCQVVVGGELRSRKGLNLPGIDLGIEAFTEHDHACLQFAARQKLDAVSQSFVESAHDIEAVRNAADALGYSPLIVAKIERSRALDGIDSILEAADAIMVARGDLGVEIPIERIAVVQKELTEKANLLGKPVITATQMLESMTSNRRPTRAEATDVANAILDGTDCVMLSEESAMGRYPVDAVKMLARIAGATEPFIPSHMIQPSFHSCECDSSVSITDLIAFSVEAAIRHVCPAAVFVPTHSGNTARRITRFRLPVWVVAVSSLESTCQALQFSYGVHPVFEPDHPDNWRTYVQDWLRVNAVEGRLAILTEGPSSKHPDGNNRMEIVDLDRLPIQKRV